jgi:hypothetical protein
MMLRSARKVSFANVVIALIFQITDATAGNNDDFRPTPSLADLQLKVGEAFTQARARIIKSGWKPIRMHQGNDYEYDGTERELADRRFLEVDFCSTDAGALCVLYYSKADKCLRLHTKGEQIRSMRIASWENACPVKKD